MAASGFGTTSNKINQARVTIPFTSGGFAECYRVERMEDKKSFALKIINKKNLEKPKAKQKVQDMVIQMISEIHLHKSVKHRNICQLDRVFQDEENVYMLLELCPNGVPFGLTPDHVLANKKEEETDDTRDPVFHLSTYRWIVLPP